MPATWTLFAAEQAVNLFSGLSSFGASRAQAAAAEGQARLAGSMERFQIGQIARQDARDRRDRLANALGSQRAALGAVGVAGGRTVQLLEARSLLNAQEEESRARLNTLVGMQASRVRQSGAVSAAEAKRRTASGQLGMDIFGQMVGAYPEAVNILEQKRALD